MFLQERLSIETNPSYRRTFDLQLKVLQNAQIDKLDELVAVRRADLKACKALTDADSVFAELEALEWLQRQVTNHLS